MSAVYNVDTEGQIVEVNIGGVNREKLLRKLFDKAHLAGKEVQIQDLTLRFGNHSMDLRELNKVNPGPYDKFIGEEGAFARAVEQVRRTPSRPAREIYPEI